MRGNTSILKKTERKEFRKVQLESCMCKIDAAREYAGWSILILVLKIGRQ